MCPLRFHATQIIHEEHATVIPPVMRGNQTAVLKTLSGHMYSSHAEVFSSASELICFDDDCVSKMYAGKVDALNRIFCESVLILRVLWYSVFVRRCVTCHAIF